MLNTLLKQLLAIPSPTWKEAEKNAFITKWVQDNCPTAQITDTSDGLIISLPKDDTSPHIALVGHSDVVPAHVSPKTVGDKLYGSGASDMQAGLACSLIALKNATKNISVLVYNREEGTGITDNGLYALINSHTDFFKSIDLAIVAEPTNNTIQLGCVGSLHAKVTITGKQAHSARPWDGDNAVYKAIPFIQAIADIEPQKHTVCDVDFHDVIELTESASEVGRTTIPGAWTASINFRYAPVRNEDEAQAEFLATLHNIVPTAMIEIIDNSYAGDVIQTPLLKSAIETLGVPVEAKQAWTDVAQLSRLGVPAFNFGPGLTSQAHRPDEYVLMSDVTRYQAALQRALTQHFSR